MKLRYNILFTILLWMVTVTVSAQISGAVIDAQTGDSIAAASVSYKTHRIAVVANKRGTYKIDRFNGWKLTFSAVGYKSKTVTVNGQIPVHHYDIALEPDNHQLSEVTVKAKRSKYSRKENPAVELMRRVIAKKKANDLKSKPYYRYTDYSKMKLAVNNVGEEFLKKQKAKDREWLYNQIELCDFNGKLIMPLFVNEKVQEKLYRKSPEKELSVIKGEKSSGLGELFETGNIADIMMSDVFCGVDIYDDQVRLLRQRFTSPIGKDAVAFYRFYIVDTLKIDCDSCIHLTFLPNNQQDFGFRGDIFIVNDSSLHVKKVQLGVPRSGAINWVDHMEIVQEFQKIGLGKGDWVLTTNDMLIEISVIGELGQMAVISTNRRYDYSFATIPDSELKYTGSEKYDVGSASRSDDFWQQKRGSATLTSGEAHTGSFIDGIRNIKGFAWASWVLKAFVENFIETSPTGKPNYVDIGPVNTLISHNSIDGMRFRLGLQTTANVNRHLFLKGYVAQGVKSKETYYNANLIYSFPPKKYLFTEYPRHHVEFMSSYDICSPSDKFSNLDKDNVFASFKWTNTENMMLYNVQKLSYVNELRNGFKMSVSLKAEKDIATGGLAFKPLSEYPAGVFKGGSIADYFDLDKRSLNNGTIRTSEVNVAFEFSPGAKYFNSKQRTIAVNNEAPVIGLSHTFGLKDVVGGQYNYNATEAKYTCRFYLNSYGVLRLYAKAGAVWSQVPYPLLIAPAANLSFINNYETFNLINDAEFLNDRFASLILDWKLNGKLFNRIPLLKKLKWREMLGFKVLWGDLTEKNNPTLEKNWNSEVLMAFPEGSSVMDPKVPYMEYNAGIENIFRMFSVYYVRRLNYLSLPTANKHSIRMGFRLSF